MRHGIPLGIDPHAMGTWRQREVEKALKAEAEYIQLHHRITKGLTYLAKKWTSVQMHRPQIGAGLCRTRLWQSPGQAWQDFRQELNMLKRGKPGTLSPEGQG